MGIWFAMMLTVLPDGALINKLAIFGSQTECLRYEHSKRVKPQQSIACVQADQLDMLTLSVWNRAASEIWK